MTGCSGHESHTPEWQWQGARKAGMHRRWGNSHLGMAKEKGSAKRSNRMCTSLVGKCLREPGRAKYFEARGRANKSTSQGTIQVHLNQETEQCSKTAEVSSEKWPERHKGLLHYSSGQVCLCVWHHLSESTEGWSVRTETCSTNNSF